MRAIAIVLLASFLAACGGNALAPAVSPHDATAAGHAKHGNVRVKMRIVIRAVPRSGRFAHRLLSGGRRNPFYTASTTQGIDVQVTQGTSGVLAETQTDISANGGNCKPNGDNSRTCAFDLPTPPGSDTFAITTYDGPPVPGGGFGGANKLGYSVITKSIVAGTAYTFPSIALSGIVSSLSLSVPIQQIHGTLPSRQALGVYALDADGNVILDSPYYDAGGSAISISLSLGTASKNNGAFKLSNSSFPSPPTQAVQLTYDGNATVPFGKDSGAFSTTIVAKATGGSSVIAAATQTVSLVGPAFTVFNVPNKAPLEIALGPDGNIWFTDAVGTVDSITPGGTITTHKIPTAKVDPEGIALGPDGNMWFGESSSNVGWVTPGTTGPAHECPSTKANPGPLNGMYPYSVVSGPGPQANLYVSGTSIAEVTTACTLVGTFPLANAGAGSYSLGMSVAPNGDIWYTDVQPSRIGLMSPKGAGLLSVAVPKTPITCQTIPTDRVDQITTDPSGNAWFTENCSSYFGRVTTAGAITMFSLGGAEGHGIIYGPDGNIWMAMFDAGIGRVASNGVVRPYGVGKTMGDAWSIAVGADDDLWFTDSTGNIGRFVW